MTGIRIRATCAQERWMYARAPLIAVKAQCPSCAWSGEFSPDWNWAGCEVIRDDRIPADLACAAFQHCYQCPASPGRAAPLSTFTWLPRTGQAHRHEFPGFGGYGPERPWPPAASAGD
jgi:hypothetical protein